MRQVIERSGKVASAKISTSAPDEVYRWLLEEVRFAWRLHHIELTDSAIQELIIWKAIPTVRFSALSSHLSAICY